MEGSQKINVTVASTMLRLCFVELDLRNRAQPVPSPSLEDLVKLSSVYSSGTGPVRVVLTLPICHEPHSIRDSTEAGLYFVVMPTIR